MKLKKHILKICLLLTISFGVASCDSGNAGDCFQTAGAIISVDIDVQSFSKVQIEGEVTLIITQGDEQRVRLETGENLLNDVLVTVENDLLQIRDGNSCNIFRDYGITKAYITVPDLTLIRNASSFDVISNGLLKFETLRLVSNTTGGLVDPRKGGDFYLELECNNLQLDANGQSVFYLEGTVENTRVSFLDENPRLEGRNLITQILTLFQRSANKIIVNPRQEIKGQILGTGDVISVFQPPVVEVEELFTGRLIFE